MNKNSKLKNTKPKKYQIELSETTDREGIKFPEESSKSFQEEDFENEHDLWANKHNFKCFVNEFNKIINISNNGKCKLLASISLSRS